MTLTMTKVIKIDKLVNRLFDSMGKGLLFIRIFIENEHQTPYHWFLEDKRKPPLDIAINPENGFFNYLSFFFQDEQLLSTNKNINCSKREVGLPVFDITDFSQNNYQVFENGVISSHLIKDDLYLLVKDKNFDLCVESNQKVSFLFDANIFVGILLNNLTEYEKEQLKLSKVI